MSKLLLSQVDTDALAFRNDIANNVLDAIELITGALGRFQDQPDADPTGGPTFQTGSIVHFSMAFAQALSVLAQAQALSYWEKVIQDTIDANGPSATVDDVEARLNQIVVSRQSQRNSEMSKHLTPLPLAFIDEVTSHLVLAAKSSRQAIEDAKTLRERGDVVTTEAMLNLKQEQAQQRADVEAMFRKLGQLFTNPAAASEEHHGLNDQPSGLPPFEIRKPSQQPAFQ